MITNEDRILNEDVAFKTPTQVNSPSPKMDEFTKEQKEKEDDEDDEEKDVIADLP